MALDLRTPIGLLFTIIGLMLVGFGAASDPKLYTRSLGINVNVWWGWVLIVTGLIFLGAVFKSRRSEE